MPRLRHTQLFKVHSKKVKTMVNDRRFLKRVAAIRTIKPITKYDVPYVAGYSEDGKTIYIDRHIKLKMKNGKDVTPLIVTHEVVEKALLDIFDLDYQQAHHIATYLEHEAASKSGIDWRQYTKLLDPQMKRVGSEKIKAVPPDLDLEPYKDEHDTTELKRLRDARRNIH